MRRMDGLDEGDEHRVRQLERRCESLRWQIAEAAGRISPPEQRELGAVEEASVRARRIAAELGAAGTWR